MRTESQIQRFSKTIFGVVWGYYISSAFVFGSAFAFTLTSAFGRTFAPGMSSAMARLSASALLPVMSRVSVLSLLFIMAAGCSSEPSDPDPTYSSNLFFAGSPSAPSHPRKAMVDFYDKVCTPTGGASYSGTGQSFECHYTDH